MVNLLNFFSVFAGLLLILIVVVIEAIYLLNLREKEIRVYFEKILKLVKLRHDFVPYFFESYKDYFPEDKKEMAELLKIRDRARKVRNFPGWEITAEKALSELLEEMIKKSHEHRSFKKDIRFLEIYKEFKDLNAIIMELSDDLNKRIKKYNRRRWNPLYRGIMALRYTPFFKEIQFPGLELDIKHKI